MCRLIENPTVQKLIAHVSLIIYLFCYLNSLHSFHWFHSVSETFLRDSSLFWHNAKYVQLHGVSSCCCCRLVQHIYDANRLFLHIPKVFIGLRSDNCEGRWSTVNSWRLKEFEIEFCDMINCSAGFNHQMMDKIFLRRDGHGQRRV